MNGRVVFMGTPEFAVPALRVLANQVSRENLLVVTPPNRPAGRGRRLQAPAVKRQAVQLDLNVLQIGSLKDHEAKARLTDFAPDLIIVAAFGLLLPKWTLELPRYGCINLHASLLPRFRGASPIPAAIACGDSESGVALMHMERGLDTGPVYAVAKDNMRHNDTTESLTRRLADTGAHLLKNQLAPLREGKLLAMPQHGRIVETHKVQKGHGAIDWNQPASKLEQHIRAMWPWPRAWTESREGMRFQVHKASIVEEGSPTEAGLVLHKGDQILVGTQDRWIRLDRLQLPGRNAQPARAVINHADLGHGSVLGSADGFEWPEPWIVEMGDVQ